MGGGKGGGGGAPSTTTTRVEPVIPQHLKPYLDQILGSQQNLFNSRFPPSLRPGNVRGPPTLTGLGPRNLNPQGGSPFGFTPPKPPD